MSPSVTLHKNHEVLVSKLKLRANTYVIGPTGSGKTHGIKEAAKECKLSFYKKLLGNQTSESSIIGYMSANGDYVKGIAYDPFVNGGILVMDEIDNGNPNTTLLCNGLADREFAFPCGMKEAHKDFILVATANTLGTGATLEYCGRNRLDMAMLNRFEFVQWDYDEKLEYKIALLNAQEVTPNFEPKIITGLVNDIINFRKALEVLKVPHIISPRNTIQASKAIAFNRPKIEILNTILFKGLDQTIIKKIFAKSTELKAANAETSNFPKADFESKLNSLLEIIPFDDSIDDLIAKMKLEKAKNKLTN